MAVDIFSLRDLGMRRLEGWHTRAVKIREFLRFQAPDGAPHFYVKLGEYRIQLRFGFYLDPGTVCFDDGNGEISVCYGIVLGQITGVEFPTDDSVELTEQLGSGIWRVTEVELIAAGEGNFKTSCL